MKQIAIIGGGISGLYAAYKLVLKGCCEISIFESNKYVGGRIKTVKYDGLLMDTGAARYNMNHTLLVSLLHDLGLSNNGTKIPNKKQYIKDGKTKKLNTDHLIQRVIETVKDAKVKDHIQSITLQTYMKEVLPLESTVDDIVYSFGYGVEFENMNAAKSIQLFKHDFMDDVQYYTLNGGMSVLICKLVAFLKSSGVTIHLNCKVLGIEEANDKVTCKTGNGDYRFSHCIVCGTKDSIKSIKGLSVATESIGQGALCRVFARFDKGINGEVWFNGMRKITTNNILRYIIPLNYENGLVMISYTDGRYADMWNDIPLKDLTNNIMIHLRKLFPEKEIPEPLWIKRYYWKEGMHYWKPGKRQTVTRAIGNNISICGEIVSDNNHGWIEGALDSVCKCEFINSFGSSKA